MKKRVIIFLSLLILSLSNSTGIFANSYISHRPSISEKWRSQPNGIFKPNKKDLQNTQIPGDALKANMMRLF